MTGAVLWDLDGTLVDSERYHWQSWRDTMAAEGITITYPQFRATFGLRNDRILQGWFGEDVSKQRIREIGEAKEAAYRRLAAAGGLEPLPGAAEWVERLHAGGWKQAIASSAPRLNVEVVMRALRFEAFFDGIVAAEDVTRGKPNPEVFLEGARRLAIPVTRAVVVEDAAAGIQAARVAGMKCVGVGDTPLLDADVFVASLVELELHVFERLISDAG